MPVDALDEIAARVIEVSNAGIDYVKVGVTPGPPARRCLELLANLPAAVVPVLLCDGGMDGELVAYAATLGFAGVMFDTAGKDGSTLFDHVDSDTLAQWLQLTRERGAMSGIAGSLGWAQFEQIRALGAGCSGFSHGIMCRWTALATRSATCRAMGRRAAPSVRRDERHDRRGGRKRLRRGTFLICSRMPLPFASYTAKGKRQSETRRRAR